MSNYSAIPVKTELQLNGAIYLFKLETKLSSVGSLKDGMRTSFLEKASQTCRCLQRLGFKL